MISRLIELLPKRALLRAGYLLALCLFPLLATPASAQTSAVIVEPTGGVTIEHLALHEQGFAWVIFAESIPEVTQYCGTVASANWVSQALVGRRLVYVNLNVSGSTVSGKQLYATLLLAHQLGRKVMGFSIWNPSSTWCEMFSARVAGG